MAGSKWENVVVDQRDGFLRRDPGVPREVDLGRFLKSPQIVVITGVRRSGKSTLLRQIADRVGEFHFVNFDDERFIHFTVADFDDLMVAFRKLHPGKTILADEIQNVPHWERFARRVHDEGYKLVLTGSNARLLGSELATHLTGRHADIVLYPFSFREVLAFRNVKHEGLTTAGRAEVLKQFDDYLMHGGFPEWLKYGDAEFVKRAYEDILHRDIVSRFHIKEIKAFRQLAHYIFSNFTKEMSYNSLKTILGFKTTMSVRNFIGYMQESFLVFEVFKYDFSLKKQHVNDKKLYVIDNGMRREVAFAFSEEAGRCLENLVHLELRRRGARPYFFRNRRECDFVVESGGRIVEAMQVCAELHAENRQREMDGLADAMETLKLSRGLIVTLHQEERLKVRGMKIDVMPAWKWLVGAGGERGAR
jgi:predicted AAA+ superfamily ATPase